MGIPAPNGVGASGLPPAGDQANAVLSGSFSAVGVSQPFAFRGPMNLALWASINTALTTTIGSLNASVASGTGIAIATAINSINVPPGTTWATFSGTSGTLFIPPITLYGMINNQAAQISNLDSTAGLTGATVTGPGIPSGTTVLNVVTPALGATLGVVQISNVPTIYPNTMQPFVFGRNGNAVTVTGADAAATFTDAALKWDATVQVERSFNGGSTWIVCNVGSSGTLAQYLDLSSVSLTFGEPERNVLYRLNCIEYTSGTINYRISQTGGAAESLAIGPLAGG